MRNHSTRKGDPREWREWTFLTPESRNSEKSCQQRSSHQTLPGSSVRQIPARCAPAHRDAHNPAHGRQRQDRDPGWTTRSLAAPLSPSCRRRVTTQFPLTNSTALRSAFMAGLDALLPRAAECPPECLDLLRVEVSRCCLAVVHGLWIVANCDQHSAYMLFQPVEFWPNGVEIGRVRINHAAISSILSPILRADLNLPLISGHLSGLSANILFAARVGRNTPSKT